MFMELHAFLNHALKLFSHLHLEPDELTIAGIITTHTQIGSYSTPRIPDIISLLPNLFDLQGSVRGYGAGRDGRREEIEGPRQYNQINLVAKEQTV